VSARRPIHHHVWERIAPHWQKVVVSAVALALLIWFLSTRVAF
jgi:hypothetical protein